MNTMHTAYAFQRQKNYLRQLFTWYLLNLYAQPITPICTPKNVHYCIAKAGILK